MKDIITYINEGFKLGKNKVIKDDFADKIMSFLYKDSEEESDFQNVIDRWIDKYNPNHITVISSTDALEEYGYIEENGISVDNLLKMYNGNNILTLKIDENIDRKCSSLKRQGKKIWADEYGFSSLYDIGESLIFSVHQYAGYFLFEID